MIHFTPIKRFADYLSVACATYKGSKIVSVGSGTGCLEYTLKNEYKFDIICVDPDPESFSTYLGSGKGLKPNFDLVSSLIKKDESTVGNCILLIIWPWYTDVNDDYDYQAIIDLKPNAILIQYEHPDKFSKSLRSGSGGKKLLKWIPTQEEYKVIGTYSIMIESGIDYTDYTLSLFSKKDIKGKFKNRFLLGRTIYPSREDREKCLKPTLFGTFMEMASKMT